jgi:hypothetical protein
VQIPESSRQFLAGLLSQLSHEQIRTLFRDSYFSTSKDAKKRDEEVDTWVRVFELKRRLIVDRKPCPLP